MSIAGPLLAIVAKMMGGGGGGNADQRELGRAEQQNADSKADVAIIRAANDAARKAKEEAGNEDPNDLDARR
jgi:hypothetical protein